MYIGLHIKYLFFFLMILEFSQQIFEIYSIWNFMEIHQMGIKLFHAGEWMDRQHNFVNVSWKIITLLHKNKKLFFSSSENLNDVYFELYGLCITLIFLQSDQLLRKSKIWISTLCKVNSFVRIVWVKSNMHNHPFEYRCTHCNAGW